jgi:hypothetical protein
MAWGIGCCCFSVVVTFAFVAAVMLCEWPKMQTLTVQLFNSNCVPQSAATRFWSEARACITLEDIKVILPYGHNASTCCVDCDVHRITHPIACDVLFRKRIQCHKRDIQLYGVGRI